MRRLTRWASRSSRALIICGLGLIGPHIVGAAQAQDVAPEVVLDAPSIDQDQRSYFEQVAAAPFGAPAEADALPVDFAQAFAQLPAGISLKHGAVGLDQATSATVVEDLALVVEMNGEDVGLIADEALFYGFNAAGLAARMRGESLDEQVYVADRIELRELTTVGMEVVTQMMTDQYIETLAEVLPLEDEIAEDVLRPAQILDYKFEVAQFLVDGLVLEPFTVNDTDGAAVSAFTLIDAMGTEDSARPVLQFLGALMASYSLDTLIYRGVVGSYKMQDPNVDVDLQMELDLAGMTDYRAGDMGYYGLWDMAANGQMKVEDPELSSEETPAPVLDLPIDYTLAHSYHKGLKLADGINALKAWQLPDPSQKDLFSLGEFQIEGMEFNMADQTLFKSETLSFAADFHWVLPTSLKLKMEDTGYDIGNLFAILPQMAAGDPSFEASELAMFEKGLDIARKYDFACLCVDALWKIDWEEETGAFTYHEAGSFQDAFSGQTKVNMTWPTPSRLSQLIVSQAEESAYEEAFTEDFELFDFSTELTDTGGLDRLFAMLHELGVAYDEIPQMAILTYNNAEQLRALSVNMLNGMKPMVRAQLGGDQADPWMDAGIAFLESGGTLRIEASPPEPLNQELFEKYEDQPDPSPEELFEIFGISITHIK